MKKEGGQVIRHAQWGTRRRLEFIDFRLLWERRINRADLEEFFGISTPQASADLKAYRQLAPDNLAYDSSERAYVAQDGFQPVFVRHDASVYLQDLASLYSGTLPENLCFIGNAPTYDEVPIPYRHVNPTVLGEILNTLRKPCSLVIRYQSMSTEEAKWRAISPHAIASDGLRFHVRAYCHEKERFQDFVLSRILETGTIQPNHVDASQDVKWQEIVRVRLAPHPDLSKEQRESVEREYEMVSGARTIEVRRALLFYLLNRLRLDEFRELRSPKSQQIIALNPEELKPELSSVYQHET